MPNSQTPCPSTAELASVLQGAACEELISRIMRHLDHCEHCVAALDRLTGPSVAEKLIGIGEIDEIQDSRDSIAFADSEAVERAERNFVNRLKSSFRFSTPSSIGAYRVIRKVGQGMMGEVFECEAPNLPHHVALKTIRNHVISPILVTRISQEARMLAGLDHPNIVRLHEFGVTLDGTPFLAMEFVGGGNLSERLRKGRLEPGQAASLVRHCALALEHAHRKGVLHRDLKPSNILLVEAPKDEAPGESDRELVPKIADFGLARYLEGETHVTQSGSLVGTPGYMSPEQIHSGNKLGPESDVYALGSILYESLTGNSPFQAQSLAGILKKIQDDPPVPPREVEPKIPRDLEIICLKCMEKRPEDRYLTAADLADDLTRFIDREPILARPVPMVIQWRRWCERNRRLAISLIFSITLLLLSSIGGVIFGLEKSRLLDEANSANHFADVQRQLAEKSTLQANSARIDSEVNRERAINERDLAVKIMDDSTTAMFAAFMMSGEGDLARLPETRRVRERLAGSFFDLASEALKIEHLERDKPIYLCGLLYKSAIIQWEMGAKERSLDLFRQLLKVYSHIPYPSRDLDGLTAQVITANETIGVESLVIGGPDAVIPVWMANWNEWYWRGEEWCRDSPISLDALITQGHKLIGVLEHEERWDDLRRIESELRHAERIYREIGGRN
ncbi:protein kinase [bacterium]|nr:protein kinase [bacterium]